MRQDSHQPLLQPIRLGDLALKNRIAMAPLTRSRAAKIGLTPTSLHAEYYAQRASAGLIISEGVWISPSSVGWADVPGLYSVTQVRAWRNVTDAVHAAGGIICATRGTGVIDVRRIGIKTGPALSETGMLTSTDETLPTSEHVIRRLNAYDLSHLLLMGPMADLSDTLAALSGDGMFRHFRAIYRGPLIGNVGFDRERGNRLIADGLVDLVAFGRPFIANPDLPARFVAGAPLNEVSPATIYGGGPPVTPITPSSSDQSGSRSTSGSGRRDGLSDRGTRRCITRSSNAWTAYASQYSARAEGAPLDTAKTHINLAYTLGALWNKSLNRQAPDEALHAVEAALGLIKENGVKEHIPATELARETILAAMGHRGAGATAA